MSGTKKKDRNIGNYHKDVFFDPSFKNWK